MNKRLLPFFFAGSILFAGACKKDIAGNSDAELTEKAAPDDFTYQTTKQVEINVRLLTRTNQPVAGVLVSFYDPAAVETGKALTKAISDENGYVKTKVNIAASQEILVIDPAYVGLIRNAQALIKNNSVTAVIGGENGFSGDIIVQKSNNGSLSSARLSSLNNRSMAAGSLQFDASLFDELGRPKNLEAVDNIDFAKLMEQVNSALPESKYVANKYLATQVPTDLSIEKLADVWITFVHEGANYRNTFAYYTYPTGQKPTKASDITDLHMVFPNASLKGGYGEGNMLQGDKVKIGRFPAGTSVGFVLIQDAYRNGNTVDMNATKFYSTEGLNPESDLKLKRHNVVLHNVSQKTFLIGFEDIDRSAGSGSDQDFNDLVVYAQSNPVEAISPVGIPFLDDKIEDTDGDGVPDFQDAYPTDPKRAYDRYYPSQDVWGTIAFEDQWPEEGDYDMNDLVISYRYKFAMSSDNKVVDLTGDYKPLAAGAEYSNGFGVELPLQPGSVLSTTGYAATSYVQLAANGLEQGQSKAVFIPFDNHRKLFGNAGGIINTKTGDKKEASSVTVKLLFADPLADEFTATAPFNPFMIANGKRNSEVHLVGKSKTDLPSPFAGKSENDVYWAYKTLENKPFAIDIYGSFDYPLETNSISKAYHHFEIWAKSGGTKFSDWYNDKPGYRNDKYIYK